MKKIMRRTWQVSLAVTLLLMAAAVVVEWHPFYWMPLFLGVAFVAGILAAFAYFLEGRIVEQQ